MAESQSLRSSFRRFFEGYLSGLGGRSAFGRLIQKAVDDDNVRKTFQGLRLADDEAGARGEAAPEPSAGAGTARRRSAGRPKENA